METLNVHQAKTHLSRLLARVAMKRESFVIARAGKPVAKVVPLDQPEGGKVRRLGFLAGQIKVPADFDRMGEEQIEALFGGRR
jgi:prevent-host-death family protein